MVHVAGMGLLLIRSFSLPEDHPMERSGLELMCHMWRMADDLRVEIVSDGHDDVVACGLNQIQTRRSE